MAKANRKGKVRVIGVSSNNGISSGWFGYAEDGDLLVPAGTNMALPVEEDVGQVIKHYGNLTIEAGAILRPAARNNGTILLVKGDLTVAGTLCVDSCAPLLNDAEDLCKQNAHIVLANTFVTDTSKLIGSNGVLVGGSGGKGGRSTGGIGGNGFWCGGGYGGGGGASGTGSGGDSEPRPPHGIQWPWPATLNSGKQSYGAGGSISTTTSGRGGSAPGGSGAAYWHTHNERDSVYESGYNPGNAGGAYGGGALWLYVQGNIVVTSTGRITANGGVGGAQVKGDCTYVSANDDGGYSVPSGNNDQYSGAGGSGGGGIIFITYGGTFVNEGSIVAQGGVAASLADNTEKANAACGNAGSAGSTKIVPFSALL